MGCLADSSAPFGVGYHLRNFVKLTARLLGLKSHSYAEGFGVGCQLGQLGTPCAISPAGEGLPYSVEAGSGIVKAEAAGPLKG